MSTLQGSWSSRTRCHAVDACKSPVTQQIPDDTDDSFAKYESAVKHIACDRKDAEAMKEKLSGAGSRVRLCCCDVLEHVHILLAAAVCPCSKPCQWDPRR